MLKFVLLCLVLSGLQAVPLLPHRGLGKARNLPTGFRQATEPSSYRLPNGFRQGTEPSSYRLPNSFRQGTEPSSYRLPNGFRQGTEPSSYRLPNGFRQGTEPSSYRLPNGFRQGTEPSSYRLPNGFQQGTEPSSYRLPNGFRQGTEPSSYRLPNGFRQGTEPSPYHLPNGFRQGTEPSFSRLPNGFRQGTEPSSYRLPNGFRQGTEPSSYRLPNGFRQGTEPSPYRLPNGFRQGTEPSSYRLPNGFRQGTEPSSYRLPNGFRQGTEPSSYRLPNGFQQGTEPSRHFLVDLNTGLVKEHISEMDMRIAPDLTRPSLGKGFGEMERRHWLINEAAVEVPAQVNGGDWVRVEEPAAPGLLDGSREASEPSTFQLPEGFRPSTSRLQTNTLECEGEVIDGRCYEFNPTPLAFRDAQSSCRALAPDADLASITSGDLHSRLVSMVTKDGKASPVLTWLGGVVKNQQAEWIDGSDWGYSDWMPGHPNIHTDKPVCLEMFRIDERWWTAVDCELRRASICSYAMAA